MLLFVMAKKPTMDLRGKQRHRLGRRDKQNHVDQTVGMSGKRCQPRANRMRARKTRGQDSRPRVARSPTLVHRFHRTIGPREMLDSLSEDAWYRCQIAIWYLILKQGIEQGDTLEYSC